MLIGYDLYESDLIGTVGIVVSEAGLEEIILTTEKVKAYLKEHPELERNEVLCKEAKKQVEEYFLGKRLTFDLPMHIQGTPFRKKVWEALGEIPYGETRSYGEIARSIGNSKACRAVGGANRANAIPLVIPCHRVVGSNGKLVGFMGDKIEMKERLLSHEHQVLEKCKGGSVQK